MKTLENWYVHVLTYNKGTPQEKKIPMMCGRMDDQAIKVLRITGFDPFTQILSSDDLEFKLGQPKKEYGERFPNAREQMLKALTRGIMRSRG